MREFLYSNLPLLGLFKYHLQSMILILEEFLKKASQLITNFEIKFIKAILELEVLCLLEIFY